MAAPMEVFGSEEEEENDEEIDVLSPNFNPLKALYASNVTLPVDDASVFNNLAEYERFMSKTVEEPGAQPQHGQKSAAAAPMSRRALERAHLQHMKEKEKELPKSTHHLKKMFQLNVLSRMEREQTMETPLDLLRQCVEKRCKIRVCIRSFKGLRSICIGYLVAFDKIWNMALSDVVEIYKRPSTGKRFHHEEKVTYSMIMSNLNPQPKKTDPPKVSSEQKEIGKKRAKECKFCRIKHETLMEQKAEAARESRDEESSSSWTDCDSSGTDDYSSTEDSTNSDVDKEMGKAESRKERRKQKTPRKPCGFCPSGHERRTTSSGRSLKSLKPDESKSKREANIPSASKTPTSSVELKITTVKSSQTSQKAASSSNPRSSKIAEVSTKKVSASSKSSSTESTTRKSDLLLSRMTSQTKQESVSTTGDASSSSHSRSTITTAQPTSKTPTIPSSSSSSSLSQAFSKSLRIGKKSTNLPHAKNQGEKETKIVKEVVHLDPKTGKRLIQPEEFKRRHVNQLFIRGDQVVMVSVDSDMVEVDVKKTKSDEK